MNIRDVLQESLGSDVVLGQELGGGGMSRVFVANDTRLGRRIVVKVLGPEQAAAMSAERFEREIRVAARLQDPHIVPLLNAGNAQGLPWFTMPFVEGESLRARLARAPVPLATRLGWLRDVARALAHAHASGVVHRDIKPENILLSNDTAVVTDFGIAKALASATEGADAATLTQHGLLVGTPAYMAPEQVSGDVVDHRADLYAWGVLAYELLTGVHPFGSRASSAMLAAHVAEPIPSLAGRVPGLPSAIADLVDRCLRKDPAERPESANALVSGLEGAANIPFARSTGRRAMAFAALLGVLGLGAWLLQRSRSAAPTRAPAAVARLAVVPFAVVGDTAGGYLGLAMTDELSTTLMRLPDLRVVPYRPADGAARVAARDLGRQLGVDAVLDGSVQRSGDSLRIFASVTRVSDGEVTWSQRYDQRVSDVFRLQDDLATAIAGSLRGRLTGKREYVAPDVPRGTRDAVAYDLYLRGRYAWSRRGERGLLSAISLYRQAIARDSLFARPHAGLAMSFTALPVFSAANPDSSLTLALASGERALALDPRLADAHVALANATKMRWDWQASERHFRSAIALEPDNATAHHWYGVLLYVVGRVDESVTEHERARSLEPFNATIGTDGALALYAARRFDDARAEIRRAALLDTAKSDTWLVQGLIHLGRQQPDSALRAFERARRLGTGFDVRSYTSVAYRALGRVPAADTLYAELRRAYAAGRAVPYDVAVAAASAGDMETALGAVDRILERHDALVTEMSFPCDPLFDPLKRDARFGQRLATAGLVICPDGRSPGT